MNDEAIIAAMREWIEQAVIGLNLCPFAKAVYVKHRVRFVVSRARHLDGLLEDLDRELDVSGRRRPRRGRDDLADPSHAAAGLSRFQ